LANATISLCCSGVLLTENVGVGAAKNIGIEMCSCELIAVMDTDDVSLPKRFEKQLAVFENQDVDVCGTWIGEFEFNETQIISYRRTPEQHNEIVAFAKGRSPVNHSTSNIAFFKPPLRICCSLPIRTLTNDSCRL
jgi:glycosyltransferase involved in cell wall biosynthesis